MEVINLNEKFGKFSDHFSPKIIAELNGQHVKLGKFKGEFIWHKHDNEDEMFMVIKGKFFMDLRGSTIEINEGEIIVIPKGTEHRPRSVEEVHVMLFEPAGTLNTGDVNNEFTKSNPLKI
ncbi:MAG: cupin domain-containing protein [Ignavibacteria bacterium]|nr:cupin domain-containing protein [Ignavibacteria bacterium]